MRNIGVAFICDVFIAKNIFEIDASILVRNNFVMNRACIMCFLGSKISFFKWGCRILPRYLYLTFILALFGGRKFWNFVFYL